VSWPAAFLASVAVVFGAGGCLPEGDPGIGERAMAARGLSGLVAGPGDTRPLLFLRWMDGRNYAGQPARVLDLYHLPPGEQTPRQVQEDVVTPLQFDARGRLYLQYGWALDQDAGTKTDPDFSVLHQLRRVDLLAGITTELGWVHQLWASPDTTHMVVHLPGDRWLTRTLDDRAREIAAGPGSRMRFIGEDVCVLAGHALTCVLLEGAAPLRPTSREVLNLAGLRAGGGAPEMVVVVPDDRARAAGIEEATQLWLVRLRDLPGQPREYLLAGGRRLDTDDVGSGESHVAVLEGEPAGLIRLRLLSFGSGAPVVRELGLPPVASPPDPEERLPWSRPRLRPGRAEAWVLATDGQLAILRADGTHQLLRVAPGSATEPYAETFEATVLWTSDALAFETTSGAPPTVRREMFTADGRWWAYRRGGLIHLADADNPGAPSLVQTPVTALRGVADILGQDRVVMWSSFGYADQVRLRLYDRTTLAPLGELDEVRRVVVGRRGMLALVKGRPVRDVLSLSPGQLVLATTDGAAPGPVQLLADNVTQFAVVIGCVGCDPIQAGHRLAYVVHARVPWKYDGLWMAELP
jgi:hypothetical protein